MSEVDGEQRAAEDGEDWVVFHWMWYLVGEKDGWWSVVVEKAASPAGRARRYWIKSHSDNGWNHPFLADLGPDDGAGHDRAQSFGERFQRIGLVD